MVKKPASLSSTLLARKGAAMPTSLEPDARTTNPVTANPIEAAETAAADHRSSEISAPQGEHPEAPFDSARLTGAAEPHITYLPDPPNPTEVRATLRLAGGVLAVIAVISGALLAISFNQNTPSTAPVAAQFATPDSGATNPGAPGAVATAADDETMPDNEMAAATADPVTSEPDGTDAEMQNTIVTVRRKVFAKNAAHEDAAQAPDMTDNADRIVTGSIHQAMTAPEALRGTMERSESEGASRSAAPAQAVPNGGTAAMAGKPAVPAQVAALPREPEAATRPAATPKEPRLAGAGDYLVQLSSLRSESAARQEWTKLQHRHMSLLENKSLDLQRTDLGDKGIYYRVRTGAFSTKTEATAFCQKLKAAGQACLVRRVPTSG